MTKQKVKQLKLTEAKKIANKKREMQIYTLHDGSEYKFYPFLTYTIIEQILLDLQLLLNESESEELELTDHLIYHLINLLIIKHSSPSLKKQFKEGLLNHIEALRYLQDADYYKEIMEKALVQKEVQKVYDALSEKIAQNNVLQEIMNKAQEYTVQYKFKNQEIFNQLNKLKESVELKE